MWIGQYTLRGHTPVPCKDTLEWGMWMETADRRVALDQVGPFSVSTVFLGLDHGFMSKVPILFETMIFDTSKVVIHELVPGQPREFHPDTWQERYATWEEAEEGHKRICDALREGKTPDGILNTVVDQINELEVAVDEND